MSDHRLDKGGAVERGLEPEYGWERVSPSGTLEEVWAGILALYERRPATGSAGAELIGLVFVAEDLLARGDGAAASRALRKAAALLEELGIAKDNVDANAQGGKDGV